MQCPNCHAQLVMTDRSGVEIDYCPQCRGVWLDRGELDKIIERASVPAHANVRQHDDQSYHHDDDDHNNRFEQHDRHNDHDNRHYEGQHKKHKKESFIGDLFDF